MRIYTWEEEAEFPGWMEFTWWEQLQMKLMKFGILLMGVDIVLQKGQHMRIRGVGEIARLLWVKHVKEQGKVVGTQDKMKVKTA